MRSTITTALIFSVSTLFAASVHADTVTTSHGVLVNSAGMTVYTFDNDTANSGKSVCNDQCAKLWPPVVADAGATPAGKLGIVTRDDGTKQWAFDGKPLYLFVNDTKAGDTKGDNVKNIWHVVKQ